MVQSTRTVELRILKADDGMVLTNGETFSSVSGEVYLGVNDSPDNWQEVTEETAEKMRSELERKINEQSEQE